MNHWLTLQAQWEKLNTLLDFLQAQDNTLIVVALGGLSPEIQQLWWQSDETFSFTPSPLLQDSLSLFTQRRWQQYRNDPALFHALNHHVNTCFDSDAHYYFDLELHQLNPDLTLLKFWLTSMSCCCRDYCVNQEDLWLQHLRLTQAMCIAMEQQIYNPNSLVGYSEQLVIIIDNETQQVVICSNQPFVSFWVSGYQFWHYEYPS